MIWTEAAREGGDEERFHCPAPGARRPPVSHIEGGTGEKRQSGILWD